MERRVIKIEATPVQNGLIPQETKPRRVAAYARISTDKDEQQTSLAAQKKYYPEFIKKHANWEFAGLYCDEGFRL